MILEIRIPSPGESVTEVAIGTWFVQDGDIVEKDQEIAEVETDKATLPLYAPDQGQIRIRARSGEKVRVGDVACTIETGTSLSPAETTRTKTRAAKPEANGIPVSGKETESEKTAAVPPEENPAVRQTDKLPHIRVTPLARQRMEEKNLSLDDILNGIRRIKAADVDSVTEKPAGEKYGQAPKAWSGHTERPASRVPLSPLRRKLAARLVAVKNETAMLTTFNEVDMSEVLKIREKYREAFLKKHNTKLGLVSFFARAASMALLEFPKINSAIDRDEIVMPGYIDLGIAVQAEKGLMVPVIRNAESLSLADLEKRIAMLAEKARSSRISIDEMTGGTFTITNGGIFGSMLSTPILNPPQSAILGMHNIVERPVAVRGSVVIRPIMYMALSYDHRIIDGADSVRFLLRIRELIESPVQMAPGENGEKSLLNL